MFLNHFQIPVLNSDIPSIFDSWITQPGYPLITVHKSSDSSTFKLTQSRFLLEPKLNSNSEDNIYWNIPFDITIKFANSEVGMHDAPKMSLSYLFPDQKTFEIKVTDMGSISFYLINVKQRGYYRVHYDDKNWNEIKEALKSDDFGGIDALTRAQIVDDLFHLTEAGNLKYDFLMDVLEFLKDEQEYLVWKAAINGFDKLSFKLPQENVEQFRESLKVVNAILNNLKILFVSKMNLYLATHTRFDTSNIQKARIWTKINR